MRKPLPLDRTRRIFDALPLLMQVGALMTVFGVVVDVAYHVGTDPNGLGGGPIASLGHLTTLVGMVVTMVGLFGAAYRRRPLTVTTPKGETR